MADGEPSVTIETGAPPLRLPRAMAVVRCTCPRCGDTHVRRLIVAADWWDREAVLQQRQRVAGLPCPRCGALVGPPAPVLQLRHLDAADLVVALPPSTSADVDRAWLAAAVRALRSVLSDAPAVVSMRASWWPYLDAVPLGPILAGLADLPEGIPDDAAARAAWLRDTRELVPVPTVEQALARYLTADDPEGEPCLVDPKWRPAIELAGLRVLAAQMTQDQRDYVQERLERLRREAVDGQPLTGRLDLPPDVAAAVDRALVVDARDPRRLPALEALVAQLRPGGPSEVLSAALTSLVPARIAAPTRRLGADDLEQLALESLDVATRVFGPDHRITVSNELNLLLVRQDAPHLTPADVAALADAYEAMLARPAVHRSGHLVDVLINLATLTERRTDLGRGERQELMLRVLEDAAHIAFLTQPGDVRTRVFCLTNQAAVLRQRVAPPQRRNGVQALDRLDEAQRLDAEHHVLYPVERVQLAVNRLNALVTCFQLGERQADTSELAQAAKDVARLAEPLDPDNEMAVKAMGGAGAVLVELYGRTVSQGHPEPALWHAAKPLLEQARERADALYAPGTPTRLTIRLNLAGLYGMSLDGRVADADACADLMRQVADEAAGVSPEHEAVAWTNLAGLNLGQGHWAEGAVCYGHARSARRALVALTAGEGTRLGEVIATGDLAVREALAHVHEHRLDLAVAALEDGRATLLRHRRPADVDVPPAPDDPAHVVVYLGACGLGALGVVRSHGQPDRGFLHAVPHRDLRESLRALVTARTRPERMLAFRRVEALLAYLVTVVGVLVGDEARELSVVACGLLAGAPLHAVRDNQGRTWLDRWPVRYWPSAQVAAQLRRPQPADDGQLTAVAVAGDDDNLPLARWEIAAVSHLATTVKTPPADWLAAMWLRGALREAGIAHLACHGRSDLADPLGSWFDFGRRGRLAVADLLEWDELDGVQLVVASACSAGVPASDAPDEFLGIGVGLLHVGVQAVVSPLWDVADASAALVSARFYAELARGREPARALREAQLWLRDTDVATLTRLGESPADGAVADASWLPRGLVTALVERLHGADPADRPYRHPIDWAAFTYLGA